jgi:thiol:disulfide interchange protein DsbD
MKPRLAQVAAVLLAILPEVVLIRAFAAGELLEPEQAFRFSAELVAPATVRVRYQIADGYYLYRDRFRFTSGQAAVKFGAPHLPDGKIQNDEFFGKVETYRGALVIDLPLKSKISAGGFTLNAVSQGCADIGVCYTPLTQSTKVTPVAYSDSSQSVSKAPSGFLARLRDGSRSSIEQEQFLPVEKAFTVEVRAADARMLVARLTPADSYYLYRDKIRFSIASGEKVGIETVQLPPGETKQDPNFGQTEVFHAPVQALIRLKRQTPEQVRVILNVGFQGCSEKGLCYPPVTRQFPIALAALPESATPSMKSSSGLPVQRQVAAPTQAEDRRIAGLLETGNFWLVMASFLGFGLLLSFTPCVLPMIPIVSGMIAGQGNKVTRKRGFVLAATYVFGMAIAYAMAGVIAGLSGTLLSAALQNPWVLGTFAGVFVLLALSMFGFYELQLPSGWQTSASGKSNKLRGGTLAGVFAMGALSAVIVGPCVAAPLAGALLYVGQSRDILLGGSALFVMALGMGLPLLVIGTSAGALLPKAGAWMQTVRNFFGVLLLGTAIWIVSPLIPVVVQMFGWAALLIISGVYLHAFDALPAGASGFRKLWKGVGVIAVLTGIALLAGGLSGGRDLFQPLSGLRTRANSEETRTRFVRVASLVELEGLLRAAGKPAMLDFYADWCVSCKEMERFTFQNDEVRQRFAGMLLLQADVTANSAEDAVLLKRFGLFGPPGIIFFDSTGKEIEDARVIGYQPAERFLAVLDRVAPLPR